MARRVEAEHLLGPAIATTYEHAAGELRGHHVRATDAGEHACVEHLVTNCVACGRTPGEHQADAASEKARGRDLDCAAHRKRPACKCKLAHGEAI